MRTRKRIFSLLLCCAMMISTCPQTVFATGTEGTQDSGQTITETGGLCEHHTEHTADCGYTEGTPETACAHEHTPECYPEDSVSGNEAAEPTSCTHTEHDGACGYAPATEGKPCGYECAECAKVNTAAPSKAQQVTAEGVQELIDALPTLEELQVMTADEQQEVYTALQAAYDAYEALTGEEQAQLTGTEIFESLFSFFNGMVNALATANDVSYLDADGSSQTVSNVTVVESSTTRWDTGWYVVNSTSLAISNRVTVSGTVNLILADDCDLNINGGIGVSGDNSLTIYGQQSGTGALTATASGSNAGIGGGGTIIINGGVINATGGTARYGGAGIGGNGDGSSGGAGGIITINGGTVTATGGSGVYGQSEAPTFGGGAGIGGGAGDNQGGAGGTIAINGGTVTATGKDGAASIGGGGNLKRVWAAQRWETWQGTGGNSGTITISGGTVTADTIGNGGGNGDSTGTLIANGNAIIFANNIHNKSNMEQWSGAIFQGDSGQVYGNSVTFTTDMELPAGKTLTIPKGTTVTFGNNTTLINKGYLYNDGAINGKLDNQGNSAIVTNSGTISGTVNNGNGSTITNSGTISGTLTNDGTIYNTGTLPEHVTGNGTVTQVSGTYLDEDKKPQPIPVGATTLSAGTNDRQWSSGWYVIVGQVEYIYSITVSGDVHLVLQDGSQLEAKSGIVVNEGNNLTIYAQSTNEDTMGQLKATAWHNAAIGGSMKQNAGAITINGGKIDAIVNQQGDAAAAGIGGGGDNSWNKGGSGGTITINGGIIYAQGGSRGNSAGGAGIGGGLKGDGGTIVINGGTVTAVGGNGAAGIGGGGDARASGGNITINDGTVTATGGHNGPGIGNGYWYATGGEITITGGTVTAEGKGPAAGIGGGFLSTSGQINISGGTVTATGGSIHNQYSNYDADDIGCGGNWNLDGIQTPTDNDLIMIGENVTVTNKDGQPPKVSTVHGADLYSWTGDGDGHWHPCRVSECTVADHQTGKVSHTAAQEWKKDSTRHWHLCSVCGAVIASTQGNHTWSGTTCTICQAVREATPKVSISYTNETLSTTTAMEYSTDNGTWASCSANMAATDFGWNGTAAVTVNFRTKATTSNYASEVVLLTIPARLEAPTGISGVNEQWNGEGDGKITGLTANGSYQISYNSGVWQDKTADTSGAITSLAAGSYKIRLKATNGAFASEAADVTIASGQERTYTLNVTAPTFDAVAYGYTQPNAKGITISSTGNSNATITGVSLSGAGESSFTLNKTDNATITAGATDSTTYTVRPNAGLAVGTYTAEITVTYNNGATAKSTVTFTVNKAEQEAPDAPELESKTTSSITLKEIAPNSKGADAEYRMNGGAWQTERTFSGLSSNTSYSFEARYAATDNHEASQASSAVSIATNRSGGGYNPPVYYTLSFETNGGDKISPVSGSYNALIDLSKYEPKRSGYTFTGWYSDKGLTNKITSIRLNGSKTVYAGWQAEQNPNTGANPFTDVSEKDWFYGDVMFVYENGLMLGTSKTTFSPYGTATRGMMATILWRMEGSPAPKGKNSFTDVEAGTWYADAITWTAENGIFAGYGKDKFGPDDPITREQLAAIFYRYADYKGYDLTVKGNLSKFKDADKISDYAKTAMQWAVGSGLVKGKSGNLLDPQGTATRAEIAAMLHRFIEKYELVQGTTSGGMTGWIRRNRLQIPQTGDSSALGLWGFTLCASLAAFLALTTAQLRRREEEATLQIIEK